MGFAVNPLYGIVERNGNSWIENLTLTAATNWLSLSVTDSAGNIATMNISPVSPIRTVSSCYIRGDLF